MSLAAHIRRARKHGVSFERFEDEEIFERDGYECQTCGKKCDPRLRAPDLDAATLGHEWPMAAGGPHFKWNCICQCWACNSEQWAKEDASVIARIKRLAGVTSNQFLRREKRKAEGRPPLIAAPANAWRGKQRGFDKTYKRKMDGTVERRGLAGLKGKANG